MKPMPAKRIAAFSALMFYGRGLEQQLAVQAPATMVRHHPTICKRVPNYPVSFPGDEQSSDFIRKALIFGWASPLDYLRRVFGFLLRLDNFSGSCVKALAVKHYLLPPRSLLRLEPAKHSPPFKTTR